MSTSHHVNQTLLENALNSIFKFRRKKNVKKGVSIKHPHTGQYLEVDVWYPDLNLCFEFQDDYHYCTTWYHHKPLDAVQDTDYTKRDLLLQRGYTLVSIPCWWNGSEPSLKSTINFHRPDLELDSNLPNLPSKVSPSDSQKVPTRQKKEGATMRATRPIQLNPPHNFFKKTIAIVPGIGELMLASFPLTSSLISKNVWWLGEKYDGVRYSWNPQSKQLYSRYRNEFLVLPQIVVLLPTVFTEGEFWFGRGFFPLTFNLINKLLEYVAWDIFRMVTFDKPPVLEKNKMFEVRYAQLLDTIPMHHPFTFVAPRFIFKKPMSYNYFVQNIVADGGEGVILRRCGSYYEPGRSFSLLKLKSVFGDMEGIVIGISLRSVHLQLPNGTNFSVPTKDVHIKKLKLGDIVTFSYENHTRRNVLVNPKVSRVRGDVTWQDVVENYSNLMATNAYLRNYRFERWNTHAMRRFMQNYAWERNLDPSLAETWYNLNQTELLHEKKGKLIVQKFGGYAEAVKHLFPDIYFYTFAFSDSIWDYSDKGQQREFLEHFAKKHGFDPLNPEHWYLHRGKLLSSKHAKEVTNYYNQSITKALLDLFPDIGLHKARLIRSGLLYKKINRRKCFENYAKTIGFDPLTTDNWYKQSKEAILKTKNIRGTLRFHGGNVATALLELFPEIGLVRSKLVASWTKNAIGRQFFETYANSNGFDPLNPENWYSQSKVKIKSLKGAASVLRHFSHSVSKALLGLFPDVAFDESRLLATWTTPENRRIFFEKYAKESGFDPLVPGNWYLSPLMTERDGSQVRKLDTMKGVNTVLWYHSNSASKALFELFPEIGLNKQLLDAVWKKPDTRRKFFENYAQEHGFDPLIADNWYSSPIHSSEDTKGLRSILCFYTNNVSKAISDLFPEIGFDRKIFSAASKKTSYVNYM